MDTQESFIFWIRLLIYIFPIKKEQCTKKCTQYLNSICLIHSSYHDFEAISAKQHKHNTILSTNRSTILTLSSMARECQHDKSISVMAPHQKSHPRPWKSTKEERWQSFQHRSRRLKRWKRGGRRERGVNFQRDSCSPAVKLKFPPLKRDSSSLSLSLSTPAQQSQSHDWISRASCHSQFESLTQWWTRVARVDRSIGPLSRPKGRAALPRVYPLLMTHAEPVVILFSSARTLGVVSSDFEEGKREFLNKRWRVSSTSRYSSLFSNGSRSGQLRYLRMLVVYRLRGGQEVHRRYRRQR